MFFEISDGVKMLCKAIVDNPDDWRQGEYEFFNKKHSDLRIWTINGTDYICISGNDCFTCFEKRLIAKAIKQSTAKRLENTLKKD